MVAGAPPFMGVTSADFSTAAILNVEPVPLELKVPHVPTALARLTARALRKSRLDRLPRRSSSSASCCRLKNNPIATDAAGRCHPDPDTPGSGPTPRTRLAKRTRLVVLPFRMLRPVRKPNSLLSVSPRGPDDVVEP